MATASDVADFSNLTSGAMCDPMNKDLILDQSLMLMARCEDLSFGVGTAFVLGFVDWETEGTTVTTVIAVTAAHCLTNLPKRFGILVPEPPKGLPPGFFPRTEFTAPWTLMAGGRPDAGSPLWRCIFQSDYIDDLALILLRPANQAATKVKFAKPMICFGNPKIGDELWGFGFANCRETPGSDVDFEANPKLAKGKVSQYYDGTRCERLVTGLPVISGMSGGPVFWARMLVGVFSSTLPAENGIGFSTDVMRVRQIVNYPLVDAPAFADQRFEKVLDLAEYGAITIPSHAGPIDETILVNAHNLSVFCPSPVTN